ncbi:MAG TPA: DoxX family protein [Casimicrobiaceae bacterium]|nr:DoxX family protein [Casimicrobiaceae bacterium]
MSSNRRIDAAAILLRMALGIMFIAHAMQKYFIFTLPGTAKFFESVGLPGPLAYVIFALELAGGALLIIGIKTRWVAAVLAVELIGATWPHLANGWMFTAKGGGWEYPAFLAVTAIASALLGNGSRDDIGGARS